MQHYIKWIVKNSWLVLAITASITVLLIIQAKNLQLVIDTDRMLPQAHPYVEGSNLSEELFGSRFVVVIGIEPKSGDVFQPEVLARVKRITDALKLNPGVVKENLLSLSARRAKDIKGTVEGMQANPIMDSVPKTAAQMDELKQSLLRNPTYFNAIISEDFKTTAIIAEFKKGDEGFGGIINSVMPIIEKERGEDVEIYLSGNPSYLAKIEAFSKRMVYLTPIAIFILALIHLEAFRTIQGLILPLATALLAIIWAVGIMGISGVPLDVFNATTPILILAVAAGHAVQLLKRYYEEYHRLRESSTLSPKEANKEAVIQSITKISPVMLAAGGVAATAFFSLMVFEILVVKTFGFLAGVGILSALVIELTFTPALRSMLPPPGEKEFQHENKITIWDRICDTIAGWVIGPKRRNIYWVVAAFSIFALFGFNQVQVDNSAKSMFTDDWQFVKDDAALNTRLGGTERLYFLVEGKQPDTIKDPQVLKAMDATQRFLEQQSSVGKTLSLADFVRRMNMAMNEDAPAFDVIPDNQELISQYLFLYSLSGEPSDFDSYVDYDYQIAQINVFLKTGSTAYLSELVPKLLAFAKAEFPDTVEFKIGGSVPGASALNETMVRDKALNILQLGVVIMIVVSIMFRSLFAGALVLLPLLLAVLVNFGVMLGWGGILLNIPNSLSSAMAIGIGADYAIYLIYRMREEIAYGGCEEAAVRKVYATAGKASLFVASAVAAGYSVLLLSKGFYIHVWLGILIATSMITSVFAALALIPALILQFRPKFVFASSANDKQQTTQTLGRSTGFVIPFMLLGGLTLSSISHNVTANNLDAKQIDAKQIMTKNYSVSRVPDSKFNVTFTLVNKSGSKRVRQSFGATKLKEGSIDNKRMTRFTAPADIKNTATLLIENSEGDDDMWIYLPALKKVRRLVSGNKKNSFAGTDFSYGDILGHKVEDWRHKIVRQDNVDGEAVWVIESLPGTDQIKSESGYSKRLSWIRKNNFAQVKGEYYDLSGQLLKTTRYSNIKQVDAERNKWQPMKQEARNVQTGHSTTIEYADYSANQNIADKFFSTRYLEKGR
ncbi:outer membrane lipoprotein-sorting protein [Aliikangiella sp. IMCC44359]|uniref:outer membrane lipoprotein-sorting protein n=1 Tax=Aliikangiella sp. IMCC44359 TaxID=3459125 RepID=UPI00403A7DC9